MEFNKLMDYQNMLQKTLKKEELLDKKIELLSIINQLTSGPKNLVQKEQILVEAESHGMNEAEVVFFLEKLKEDNIIYESSPGYIKKR